MSTVLLHPETDDLTDTAVLNEMAHVQEILPSELVERLRTTNRSEAEVRRAIWRLISQNLIQLSPEQKLLPVEKQNGHR
jgi:hypothetical protein